MNPFSLTLLLVLTILSLDVRAQEAVDRSILPIPEPARPIYTQLDVRFTEAPKPFSVKAPKGAPNVVIVLIDDMGFGVADAFGGPVAMPNLTRLAMNGIRFNRFHTTAVCVPIHLTARLR